MTDCKFKKSFREQPQLQGMTELPCATHLHMLNSTVFNNMDSSAHKSYKEAEIKIPSANQ